MHAFYSSPFLFVPGGVQKPVEAVMPIPMSTVIANTLTIMSSVQLTTLARVTSHIPTVILQLLYNVQTRKRLFSFLESL